MVAIADDDHDAGSRARTRTVHPNDRMHRYDAIPRSDSG
jgi:hypothetical protein